LLNDGISERVINGLVVGVIFDVTELILEGLDDITLEIVFKVVVVGDCDQLLLNDDISERVINGLVVGVICVVIELILVGLYDNIFEAVLEVVVVGDCEILLLNDGIAEGVMKGVTEVIIVGVICEVNELIVEGLDDNIFDAVLEIVVVGDCEILLLNDNMDEGVIKGDTEVVVVNDLTIDELEVILGVSYDVNELILEEVTDTIFVIVGVVDIVGDCDQLLLNDNMDEGVIKGVMDELAVIVEVICEVNELIEEGLGDIIFEAVLEIEVEGDCDQALLDDNMDEGVTNGDIEEVIVLVKIVVND